MYTQEPTSYRVYLSQREQVFHAAVAAGEIEPFVYPWGAIPAGILILAVLFLPRRGLSYSRWISCGAFSLIILSCIEIMRHCRSTVMASGYGLGLMCVWGMVWSAAILVYNDPRTAFKRVEWRDTDKKEAAKSSIKSPSIPQRLTKPSMRNRGIYGVVGGPHQPVEDEDEVSKSDRFLVWQSYPGNFRHRLDWVMDLCTSFRGPGWNWHIQTLPAAAYPSPTLLPAPPSSTNLLKRIAIRDFLIWYLIVDILKTISMNDPYFWGIAPISSPAPNVAYLPSIVTNNLFLIKMYRLLLTLASVISALTLIFTLCPLVFAGLFPLFKLDQYTRAPLLEPLLYPPYWGDFATSVLDKGLAGWWGKWWHQMFRMGISEPSRFLLGQLGWDPRSQKGKLLQLIIAFTLSGTIHAGGSYTALNPESRPLSGPFVFFCSQAFGILAEQFVFKTMGISKAMSGWPRSLRRVGTMLYVLAWFYITGPWLADDFARCGVWLFEPIPISPMRGLGLGFEGEGWWCWHGTWARWWSGIDGTPWWRKGIAI